MREELNTGLFKEIVDNRQKVPKKELDKMKIEAFDRILEKSLNFYETYDTVEGREYDFASQAFGEWVEEYIVEFHNLVAEEGDDNVKKLELRPDIAPEITVKNSTGTLSVHPTSGEERVQCQTTTYTFRYKGEIISRVTQWRFEDGLELERVSSHYSDGEHIRRTQDELKDRTIEEFMRHWEKGYDAAT